MIWMFILGLAGLVAGAELLVRSAGKLALSLGISPLVVGLTVVSFGTSAPEVAVSIGAVLDGKTDIAIGNVVGSNIFNILGVLGTAGIVAPMGIEVSPAVVSFDIPVMIAVAFACLPIFFTGGIISRQEGALLLGYYVAYTLYIVLAAAQHEALSKFSAVMLYFVVPLTMITLITVALLELRSINNGRPK